MADEIYSSSYWGNGVCDNTIDWGVVYKDYAGCTPTPPVFTNTYSLSMDGVDDYLETNSKIIGSDITLSGWVNFNGSYSNFSAHFPMSITPSNLGVSNETLGRFYKDGSKLQIAIQCNDNTGANFSTYYVDNTTLEGAGWQHICLTYNATTGHIYAYLNGVTQNWVKIFAASTPIPFLTAVSGRIYESNLTIGRYNAATSTGTFQGLVDEVSTYNRILTQSEITSISSTPTDLTSLNPVAWYRCGDNGTWKSPQWLIPNNINVANSRFSNYSFDYDGIDDFVDTGSSTLSGETALSISAWVYPTAYGDATAPSFVSTDEASPRAFYLGLFNGTNFRFSLSTNGTSLTSLDTATSTVTLNAWQHILVTWDQINLKLYKNGVLLKTVATTSSSNGTFTTTNDLLIGARRSSAGFFEGNIDEVAIWNSVQDASLIYNSGVPSDISSLSPVGYWRSEQSNFTDNWLVDNSALSNYSTRSFNFDGIDDYIDVGVISTFQSTANFSVSCWLKVPNLSASNFFIGTYTSGSNTIYSYIATNGEVVFNLNNTYQRLSGIGTPLLIDNWYNIILVYDGTLGTSDSMLIYINGILRSGGVTAGIPATTGTNTGVTYLGGLGGWTSRFTGDLDEVSFFNTSLTPSEITSIYNSGTPTTITGATSHWRMGEDATFNTNWNVPDNAGSNTGTSANMTISDLEGEAPNYTGGGLSNNMTIEDRVGDAPNSSNNALSYNMDEVDRETDVPT